MEVVIMTVKETEKFYAKIWKQGDSLVVTIPSNLVRFGGFCEGDEVTVLLNKNVSKVP